MFSSLSKGYGSWTGDLHAEESISKRDLYLPSLPYLNDHKHGVTVSRAKSASSVSFIDEKPDGEIVLPKTYLTRHGALLLFTDPNRELSKKKSKTDKIKELKRKFGTLDRLATSVLQYGDEAYDPDVSITDSRNQCVLHFLRGLDEIPIDIHSQPGGDYEFYLRDLKSRSSSRARQQDGATTPSQINLEDLQDLQDELEQLEKGSEGKEEPHSRNPSAANHSRENSSTNTRRTRSVLSANSLTANLKSTKYLGRPSPVPVFNEDDMFRSQSPSATISSISYRPPRSRPPSASSVESTTNQDRGVNSVRISSARSRHSKSSGKSKMSVKNSCQPSSMHPTFLSSSRDNVSITQTRNAMSTGGKASEGYYSHSAANEDINWSQTDPEGEDQLTELWQSTVPPGGNLKSGKPRLNRNESIMSNVDGQSETGDLRQHVNQWPEETDYTYQPPQSPADSSDWGGQSDHLDEARPRSSAMSAGTKSSRRSSAGQKSAKSSAYSGKRRLSFSSPGKSFCLELSRPESQQLGDIVIDDSVNHVLPHTVESIVSARKDSITKQQESLKSGVSSPSQRDEINDAGSHHSSVRSATSRGSQRSAIQSGRESRTKSSDSRKSKTAEPLKSVADNQGLSPWRQESPAPDIDEADLTQSNGSRHTPSPTGDQSPTLPVERSNTPDLEEVDDISTPVNQQASVLVTPEEVDALIAEVEDSERYQGNLQKGKSVSFHPNPPSQTARISSPRKQTSSPVKHILKKDSRGEVPKLGISSVQSEQEEKQLPEPRKIKPLSSDNLIADTKAEIEKIFGSMPRKQVEKTKEKSAKPKSARVKEKEEEPVPELFVPDEVKQVMEKTAAGNYQDGISPEELELEQQILKLKMEEAESKLDESNRADQKKKKKLPDKKEKKSKLKKSPEELEAEKEAIREKRRLENEQRVEEQRQLQEKIAKKELEKKLQLQRTDTSRKKMEADMEAVRQQEMEAKLSEDEARMALEAAKKTAREDRERKRKEDLERKKQEAMRRREEERRLMEAAKTKELEMLERISDAESVRRKREEERRRREEQDEIDEENLEEELRLAQLQAEEEEERMMELERQAEEEAMARLVKEREDAQRLKERMEREAQKMREAEEREMQKHAEEQRRLEEEMRIQMEEDARKQEAERLRVMELQRLEEEARERMQQEVDRRRQELLARREVNLERKTNLDSMKQTQGMTKPWVFSYYVLWPRETYERTLGDNKKKGFRPKKKK